MRKIALEKSNKAKVRGLKRKTSSMLEGILKNPMTFPEEDSPNCGYWHTHLPVAQDFLESPKTPDSIRKACMQAMIDKVEHLISIKPKSNTKTRVVAHINETSLWYSEITIFFGEEYYSNFFTRNSKFQTWNEMPENQSLVKKNHLIIPAGLTIKGYFELLGDEDDDWEWQNNLWYIGELD